MSVPRAMLAALAIALAACSSSVADAPLAEQWEALNVIATPVDFGPAGEGRLRFRGGLQLQLEDDNSQHDFGGLSGMEVLQDGRLIAVSDFGDWIEARLVLDEAGSLTGIEDVRGAVMRDENAQPFANKEAADAEDLTQLTDGRFAVSFEQTQSIRIYDLNRDGPFGAARPGPQLEGASTLPPNNGLEALSVTESGALVAGAEGGSSADTPMWVAPVDARAPVPPTARYRPERGYSLTGLDRLPDGDFVALERFYAPVIGPRARITRFSANALMAGGEITPEELLRIAPPMPVDNFEAISAVRAPDGAVRIYILSDDNFSERQRTLLLAFDLVESQR